MTSRIQKLASRITAFAICALATWMFCLSATAQQIQDFSVAYQRDAGESADDDPEDTGDRDAVDAVDDAEQRAAETLTAAEQKAALERRAGERVAGRPLGRANVLGMSLQEGEGGRAHVVDVAAASPAFDAGVRKGDVITSFAGFQGESYRDWIEGMDRLVTDTPDGETIDVELMRGTQRVAAIVRAPEAKADDPRLPGLRGIAQQETQIPQGQRGFPAMPPPNQIINGSGTDVFIGNDPFAAAFQAGGANVHDRAMAEIVRLNPQQQATAGNPANTNTQRDAATGAIANRRQPATPNPTAASGRIGVAGFRNDANGLLVMIDIAGLEPGNYRVGIDDAGLAVGADQATSGFNPGAAGAVALNAPQANSAAQAAAVEPTTSTNDAAQAPVDGRTDQSDIPPSGQARSLSTPPSGQARPLSTPPSGQTRPLTSTPTGLPDTRQPGRADAPPSGAPQSGAGTLSQVGVLTVDQSGTGRLQQIVEGVQVADIVGQAIVLYAPAKPAPTAIPPDANVSGVREAAGDPNVPAQSQAATTSRDAQRQALPAPAAAGQVDGGTQPVAAGMIRLLSDRRPSIGANEPSGGQLNSQPQAPANATDSGPAERALLPQQQRR
jgi:hypothetical protein